MWETISSFHFERSHYTSQYQILCLKCHTSHGKWFIAYKSFVKKVPSYISIGWGVLLLLLWWCNLFFFLIFVIHAYFILSLRWTITLTIICQYMLILDQQYLLLSFYICISTPSIWLYANDYKKNCNQLDWNEDEIVSCWNFRVFQICTKLVFH